MGQRSTVYNAGLVTEEKWARVSTENKELFDGFIEYLDSSGKSDQTIKQYTAQLKIVMVYIMENCENKAFTDLKKRELIKFAGWLQNVLKVSPNRISSIKSVISSFSNYIELVLDDEYPEFRNLSSVISAGVKQPVREKTILSVEDIDECLQKLAEAKKYQVACFMALLYGSGMRKAEAIQMRVDDFVDANKVMNGMFYRTRKIRTKGRGKAGKILQKYVTCDIIDPYFQLWMDYRKENGIESEWLFISGRDGECATISTANSFADTMTNFLGVPGYCHNFRHAWCTHMHKKGYPETVIQQLQGWAGLDMVSLYNDTSGEEELENFFAGLANSQNEDKSAE